MARASTPSLRNDSVSRSALRFVRVNTMVRELVRHMAAVTFTLSSWWTWMKRWAIPVTVAVLDATSWYTGSVSSWRIRRSTSPSRVAEKSIDWCGRTRWRSSHSTWGVNPMSAIRSASSSTTVSIWPRSISPRCRRSMSRPGVAITTSSPARTDLTWASMLVPP